MKAFVALANWFSRQFLHHQSFVGYLEPVVQLVKPSWRSGYYRAKVLALIAVSENTLALELKTEANWPIHSAGQHIELTFEINGALKTRLFTIASSPNQAMHEGVIRLVIKRQEACQRVLAPHKLNLLPVAQRLRFVFK